MKILIVGEYAWPWYQEACATALEELGAEVVRFGWLDRFKHWVPDQPEPQYRSLSARVQFRYLNGPIVHGINRDLVRRAAETRPDIIWFYNAQLIFASTVRRLKRVAPNAVLAQFANDDPFNATSRRSMWRHFLRGISAMDVHFAYRHDNLREFIAHGARSAHLLRSYFIPATDFPLDASDIAARFDTDVVFAGHYEHDGRVAALESLCRAGLRLNLFGGGWDAALPRLAPNSPLRALYPIRPVTGVEYNAAICGAKVALCFLSTLNRDTYTRRSFQIPAMRSAMLSQRTDDLTRLFREDEEALFFSSIEELVTKARMLVRDEDLRRRIAVAGYDRVYADGHDVRSRMHQWLNVVTHAK